MFICSASVIGLLGVASAPDFLVKRIEYLDAETKAKFELDGFLKYPDTTHGPYTITKATFEDAQLNRVFVNDALSKLSCKVRRHLVCWARSMSRPPMF